MNQKLPIKELFALGFFMFALFLGAGNLIFPPLLGQQAGNHVWAAILGFLVTGVGLPILGIFTIAQVGGSFDALTNKVHPKFSIIFPVLIYLTIGPFFGMPRTGTVAYEIGVTPFLVNEGKLSLFISTFIFFSITFWLSLNPAKLVDRVGKILTPVLLILITVIAIRGVITPLGNVKEAQDKYIEGPFFSGFLEGFLTMDAIAALVFGTVIIHRIQEKGITSIRTIRSYTIKAGIIAGTGLSFVYISLAYIGATSVNVVGSQSNGGAILSYVTSVFFGPFGTVLLALVITGACLTTAIGLVSACGEFLSEKLKRIPYSVIIGILCLFSFTMANLGLTQLISVSLPILIAIYPITIVLIILSILHTMMTIPRIVYIGTIIGAGIVSIYDGITAAGLDLAPINSIFSYLPFYTNGVGWLLPSIIGGGIGYFMNNVKRLS